MQDFTIDLESLGVAKPYSMEAEQSVLGAALLESETVLPELLETLRPEMFYARQNGEIFSEMVRLFTAGERVDLVTLMDAVVAAGVFESPDAAKVYLARLGCFDGHAMERLAPDFVADMSYTAFGREEARYLIAYETQSAGFGFDPR